MKFAGNVTAILGRRLLVVRSDARQLPPLYSEVTDADKRIIGKIVDLYGSVARPYLTVLCNDGVSVCVGSKLYVIPGTKLKMPKKRRNASGYKGNENSHRLKTGGSIWKKKSRS
ncbi:MAG TPA: H/ACA ribonucleoprotein complex subunit GAR1 [Methanocorpusculum sp.]|nr:H/ACA ribonucleoprotein complex subunit GAR1 [Methanocorpusculum sp.]